MFAGTATWAWLLGLFVLFTIPDARAADRLELPDLTELPEVHDPTESVPQRLDLADPRRAVRYDLAKYGATRARWRTGMVLGLVGSGMLGVGVGLSYLGVCNPYACILGLGGLGIGIGVVGMGLSMSGAWANANVLRRGGLDVSVALSVTSLVVSTSFIVTGLLLGLTTNSVAILLIPVGYVVPFIFSAVQMGTNGRAISRAESPRTASRRGPALALAPTVVQGAPGIAIAARW